MIDKEFLESVGVTDAETVEKITSAYTADIQAEQTAAADLKTKLAEADSTIKSYKDMDIDSIKKSAEEWKQKAEQLEADQKAKAYSDNLDKFVQTQGLKNDIYAAHLKSQLMAAELKFDEKGKLIGGEDIVNKLKESCPDAFTAVEGRKPHFTDSTSGGDAQGAISDDMIRKVMGLD